MQKQTVTMPGYMGKPHNVTGEVSGGLILHKMGQSWSISQVASGKFLGNSRKLKTDAKAKMQALLALGADWSLTDFAAIAASAGANPADFMAKCRAIDEKAGA